MFPVFPVSLQNDWLGVAHDCCVFFNWVLGSVIIYFSSINLLPFLLGISLSSYSGDILVYFNLEFKESCYIPCLPLMMRTNILL